MTAIDYQPLICKSDIWYGWTLGISDQETLQKTGLETTIGRFKIIEKLNPYVYRLALPDTMAIHNVFHVEKLRPVANDPFPGQVIPEQPPVEVDGEQEWEVEEILDAKKIQGGHVKYLVKWTGYDAPTWELASLITHADEALEAFYRLYPDKPRPRGARPRGGGPNVTAV